MKKQIKTVKSKTVADTGLLKEIRKLIFSARNTVVRNIDTIQVITNFEIGRRIVNYEQRGKTRAGYGEKTLEGLSQKLIQEFGRGFSVTNLKLIRQFFLMYSVQIGQTLSGQSGNNQKRQTVSDQLQKTQVPAAQLVKAWSLSRESILSWSH